MHESALGTLESRIQGKGKGIFNVSLWDQVDPSDDFYPTIFFFPSPGFAQVPSIARPIKFRVKIRFLLKESNPQPFAYQGHAQPLGSSGKLAKESPKGSKTRIRGG